MALKYYKCIATGEITRSLKALDPEIYEELLVPPNQKFMVKIDPNTGKSKAKDMDGVLLERARSHSRDQEIDDNIQVNIEAGSDKATIAKNFLDPMTGRKRNKISDL